MTLFDILGYGAPDILTLEGLRRTLIATVVEAAMPPEVIGPLVDALNELIIHVCEENGTPEPQSLYGEAAETYMQASYLSAYREILPKATSLQVLAAFEWPECLPNGASHSMDVVTIRALGRALGRHDAYMAQHLTAQAPHSN